jgi:hypothetical protein
MSRKSQGSNEQRVAKKALADAGGTIEAPNWSGVRRQLGLKMMSTANVEATFKALCGRGEVRHKIQGETGNIVLVFT